MMQLRSTLLVSALLLLACCSHPAVSTATSPTTPGVVGDGKINPGKVFDLTLPLEQVAEDSRAMDERRAIKTLLRP